MHGYVQEPEPLHKITWQSVIIMKLELTTANKRLDAGQITVLLEYYSTGKNTNS